MDVHYPSPDIVIAHLGGNDIGKVNTLDLLFHMKRSLGKIKQLFPNVTLFFFWKYSMYVMVDSWESEVLWKNECLNSWGLRGFSFQQLDLESGLPGLYGCDLIYLSDIGHFQSGFAGYDRDSSWWCGASLVGVASFMNWVDRYLFWS